MGIMLTFCLISSYCWQLYKDGRPTEYVDAADKAKSNWMRFVNCACHEGHQNLIAFQYDGQVYYKTYRDIPPNTELLVWYGQQYGAELGIASEEKAISPDTGTTDNVDENMDITCSDIVNTGSIDENEIGVCCHIDQTESLLTLVLLMRMR